MIQNYIPVYAEAKMRRVSIIFIFSVSFNFFFFLIINPFSTSAVDIGINYWVYI